MAEAYRIEKLTDAVITLSAYLDDNQRQVVIEEENIWVLNVLRLINEPWLLLLLTTWSIFDVSLLSTIDALHLGGEDSIIDG